MENIPPRGGGAHGDGGGDGGGAHGDDRGDGDSGDRSNGVVPRVAGTRAAVKVTLMASIVTDNLAAARGPHPVPPEPPSTTPPTAWAPTQAEQLMKMGLRFGTLPAGGRARGSRQGVCLAATLIRPRPHPLGKNRPFHWLLQAVIWLIRANLLWIQTVFTVTGRQSGDSGD